MPPIMRARYRTNRMFRVPALLPCPSLLAVVFMGGGLGPVGSTCRADDPPVIVTQPVPINSAAGEEMRLEVVATGTEPLSYQWFQNDRQVGNQPVWYRPVTLSQFVGLYWAVVSNSEGSVTSRVVSVTMDLPGGGLLLRPRGSIGGLVLGAGSGAPVRTQLRGKHAFVAAGWDDGLHVIDVSDPDVPRRVAKLPGTRAFWEGPFDVALIDDFALVAERIAGLGIIDISNPAAPVRVGRFILPGRYTSSVTVRGRTAFVGNEDAGLVILDVDRPESPVIIGSTSPPNKANGIWVQDDLVYVGLWDDGLSVVDVSNPAAPEERTAVPYSIALNNSVAAFDAVARDGLAYVADAGRGLIVVDPALSSDQVVARFGDRIWDVSFAGRYLVTADQNYGLRLFDLLTPASPGEIGFYRPLGGALGACVRGNRILVGERDLSLLDLDFVEMAPEITVPTEDRHVTLGSDIVLEAFATGSEPMIHTWFHDGTELPGENSPTLDLPHIGEADMGEYTVEVSNAFGSTTYEVAKLSVGRLGDPVAWVAPEADAGLLVGGAYPLEAATALGRPIIFSVASGTAELDGSMLTPQEAGVVTIRALAEGDDDYLPKAAERSFQVVAPPQIVPDTVRLEEGGFAFVVQAPVGATFAVLVSEDLREWRELTVRQAEEAETPILDDQAVAGARFYRIELRS